MAGSRLPDEGSKSHLYVIQCSTNDGMWEVHMQRGSRLLNAVSFIGAAALLGVSGSAFPS